MMKWRMIFVFLTRLAEEGAMISEGEVDVLDVVYVDVVFRGEVLRKFKVEACRTWGLPVLGSTHVPGAALIISATLSGRQTEGHM
jgi:hypothetical protein